MKISKHHAIRIIIAGATNLQERPRRGVKPRVRVPNQARGNREGVKLWLLMNPEAIPILLAKKLKFLTAHVKSPGY